MFEICTTPTFVSAILRLKKLVFSICERFIGQCYSFICDKNKKYFLPIDIEFIKFKPFEEIF